MEQPAWDTFFLWEANIVSEDFVKFQIAHDITRGNRDLALLTMVQVRAWYEKAIQGKADDHHSLYLQDFLDSITDRVSLLLSVYIEKWFDYSRIRARLHEYVHIFPELDKSEYCDNLITHLLNPHLKMIHIRWKYIGDEVCDDGLGNISMNFDIMERFVRLFDALFHIETMCERGEPALVTDISFRYLDEEWGVVPAE